MYYQAIRILASSSTNNTMKVDKLPLRDEASALLEFPAIREIIKREARRIAPEIEAYRNDLNEETPGKSVPRPTTPKEVAELAESADLERDITYDSELVTVIVEELFKELIIAASVDYGMTELIDPTLTQS